MRAPRKMPMSWMRWVLPVISIALIGAGAWGLQGDRAVKTSDRSPLAHFLRSVSGPLRPAAAGLLWNASLAKIHNGEKLASLHDAELALSLAPESTSAWVFFAWHLAYNISVTESDPEKELRWVQRALRASQEGIRRARNPEPVRFFLAMIFFDRLQHDSRLLTLVEDEPRLLAIPYLRDGLEAHHLPSGLALSNVLRDLAGQAAYDGDWTHAADLFHQTAEVNQELHRRGIPDGESFSHYYSACSELMALESKLADALDITEKSQMLERRASLWEKWRDFPMDSFIRDYRPSDR